MATVMGEAEQMARRFHELFVELSPAHGYKSAEEGAQTFDQLDGSHRLLLIGIFNRMQNFGVLQSWVVKLGLRHQGTLLTAIRGCDGVLKHDPSKPVMRAIRWATMVPFDARELMEPKGFMYYTEQSFGEAVRFLSKNLDEYPLHFVLHLIHALEVIGYCHPNIWVRGNFQEAYNLFVGKFHMRPESQEDMEERLCEDRVANGTVAN